MKICLSLTLTLFLFTICLCHAQNVEVVVLGIAQDAGYPQANCQKEHCPRTMVSSLGIVDLETNDYYMIDCTPDFKDQLQVMSNYSIQRGTLPKGIFLTQAQIGNYLGLVYLGKEAIDAAQVTVHAMTRMASFIESNAPWEDLVHSKNIDLKPLSSKSEVKLSSNLSVTPILVPQTDKYSETVGYIIKASRESLLYIPAIDKWTKWEEDIADLIKTVDHAFLDGTYYANGEMKDKDMSEIPHPFVQESLSKFQDLSALERSKIHFIHMNHSNPLLDRKSLAYKAIYLNGYNVASQGLSIYLE